MEKKHEKQVCDTIIHFIAKRKHLTVNKICYPDKEKRNSAPSVDRIIECPGLEIVLEHTLIESYPEQISDSKRVDKLLGPLRTKLTGQLPKPGHYELSIDVGAVKGAKDTKNIQTALIKWIKEKAPILRVGSPNVSPSHYIREEPLGVPFQVTLYRWPRRDGEFWISVNAPEDLKKQKRHRIRKALDDKCPKLYNTKGNVRISILLLESDDMFLANCCDTAKALANELKGRDDAPDEVYLVDTEIVMKEWVVWVLKEGTKLFQDIENPGPYYLGPTENLT